ncbi:CHAT domain-containing protein [Dactylosporangium sp. AC04546]|uniref:CHAT domain-containing protein n=1 Tax=Dactylosporangium sp. AC04546 TaxID=2862460 RepID=UPI001EDF4A88|nr:CHAT domain-containing protein [Dactylosporangium sp. AC04546]WVK88929.1 CHAT domain-containing protein [Dactylosporangium sp. AC04546]
MPGEVIQAGTGRAAWRSLVEQQTGPTAPFTLAQICLLVDKRVSTPSEWAIPGLPAGRPDVLTKLAAGAALARYGADRDDEIGQFWRLLGNLRTGGSVKQLGLGRPLAELLDELRLAADAGAVLGPQFEAWALMHRAIMLRGISDDESMAAARRALALIQSAPPAGGAEPHRVVAAATGAPRWLPSAAQMRTLLEYDAHVRVATAARMLRQYDVAIDFRDRSIVVARRLKRRPMLLAQAYGERGVLARALGDVETVLRLLTDEREHAERSGSPRVFMRYQLSAAQAAESVDNWDEAARLRRERIRTRFHLTLGVEVDAADPASVRAHLPTLLDAANQTDATAVANDAYEIARYLFASGAVETDHAARVEAGAWMDAADAGWSDVAVNGDVAIGYRRLELDALEGRSNPLTIGRGLVHYSHKFRRAAGRRRAATSAAHYGDPTDAVVLQRLQELLVDAPPLDAAHLAVGMARWHLRRGEAMHAEGQLDSAQRDWTAAADEAANSAQGLTLSRPGEPDVPLDAAAVVEAHQIRGRALRRLRSLGDSPEAAAAELDARLASLPAIARRFIACGSPGQRAVLDRLYRQWLAETLELAVELSNPAAFDATAEVMRRDLVGTVLCAMAADGNTPEQIARLAEKLLATLRATVGDLEHREGARSADRAPADEEQTDQPDIDPMTRGGNLAEQVDEALDVVGTVLGPVARDLFDPQTATRYTAMTAATALYGDGPGAVLSLVLLDGGGERPRVARHLCWRTESGRPLRSELDVVLAPAWLAALSPDPDADEFFGRLAWLTEVLLPGPLVELLSALSEDRPLPLAVVPTGLLAVPFAALRAGPTLVLEKAVVSLAQSLQALTNLAGDRTGDRGVEVGVYDTANLHHADAEWRALQRHRPAVRQADTLDDIAALLADPAVGRSPGLLALAIHGSRGSDGWTQAKQLPSGELLTTGHVLRWYIPALVVGASCNTDIRLDSGGELGGFPLAFQLRGAVNIVGSLYYIEDKSTAQIMGLFYEETSRGLATAAALRIAQRRWLAANRPGRLPAYQRWAYLVTYGLPV